MILKAVPSCEQYLECYDNELPTLKEICAKLNYSDMCAQSDKMRSLLENADRYGNTIRSAFEISVIKLCDKPIVIPDIDIPSTPKKPKENTQQKVSQPSAALQADTSSEVKENSVSSTVVTSAEKHESGEYSAFNVLKEEVAKRASDAYPFFEKVAAECRGEKLFIICSDMLAKMILSNSTNLPLIKSIVAAITPEITDVIVTDKATKPKTEDDFNF